MTPTRIGKLLPNRKYEKYWHMTLISWKNGMVTPSSDPETQLILGVITTKFLCDQSNKAMNNIRHSLNFWLDISIKGIWWLIFTRQGHEFLMRPLIFSRFTFLFNQLSISNDLEHTKLAQIQVELQEKYLLFHLVKCLVNSKNTFYMIIFQVCL